MYVNSCLGFSSVFMVLFIFILYWGYISIVFTWVVCLHVFFMCSISFLIVSSGRSMWDAMTSILGFFMVLGFVFGGLGSFRCLVSIIFVVRNSSPLCMISQGSLAVFLSTIIARCFGFISVIVFFIVSGIMLYIILPQASSVFLFACFPGISEFSSFSSMFFIVLKTSSGIVVSSVGMIEEGG